MWLKRVARANGETTLTSLFFWHFFSVSSLLKLKDEKNVLHKYFDYFVFDGHITTFHFRSISSSGSKFPSISRNTWYFSHGVNLNYFTYFSCKYCVICFFTSALKQMNFVTNRHRFPKHEHRSTFWHFYVFNHIFMCISTVKNFDAIKSITSITTWYRTYTYREYWRCACMYLLLETFFVCHLPTRFG